MKGTSIKANNSQNILKQQRQSFCPHRPVGAAMDPTSYIKKRVAKVPELRKQLL